VAIARAIVTAPKMLLLDEPLSNLDAKLRIDMRSEIKRLHQEMGTTVIYVTHDQIEALTMSTRVAVFFEGVLVQVATPLEIYRNPATLRVADFIGNPRINVIDARGSYDNGRLTVHSDLGVYTYEPKDLTGEEFLQKGEFDCILGVRPEQMMLTVTAKKEAVEAAVYASQPAGSETLVQIQFGKTRMLVKEMGIVSYERDQKVYAEINPNMINVYNKTTGALIKYAV
jgi:multiple sugar transport system ATP-binding protein